MFGINVQFKNLCFVSLSYCVADELNGNIILLFYSFFFRNPNAKNEWNIYFQHREEGETIELH